jgi:hypothetical protein
MIYFEVNFFSLYPWKVAAPIIISLLVFKQPLPENTLKNMH